MRSFGSIVTAVLAFTSTAVASPLTRRASASTFLPSIATLTDDVKGYTGKINSTAGSFGTLSTADQVTALASIASDATSINSLVTSYTAQIPTIESGSDFVPVSKRQDADADTQALAGAVAMLLGEINSSLNYAEAQTGQNFTITKRQIAIIPLGASLSALLLALDQVVDNLLALVKSIVDNLLTGLAGSLVGIVL